MYCYKHGTNNCIECAIDEQTEKLIAAMEKIALKERKSIWQRMMELVGLK